MAAEIVPNQTNGLSAFSGNNFTKQTAAAQMAKGTHSHVWKEKQPATMAAERSKRRTSQW